jgi:PAS domain S-box-containing protein
MIRDLLQRPFRRRGFEEEPAPPAPRDRAEPASPMAGGKGDELFRLLVAGVKDYAIFMLDPDGRVATWNKGAARIKGYRADQIIGRHFSVFYPQEAIDRGWPAEELRAATERGSFEDESWRLRQDGSRFWANVVITAIHDESGRLRGFTKVTRDLTERRKAEETLRAAHAELDHRVALRTAELSETNARLRLEIDRRTAVECELRAVGDELRKRASELADADRQKNEFLAMLAHELRNPMAPIANGLEILAHTAHDAGGAATLAMMDRQMRTLVRLVDDLLDVSRIIQNRIELRRQTVDIGDVMRTAIETATPAIEAHRHEVKTTLPERRVFVTGDVVRLAQSLANLLTNAAKYSDRPSVIELEARYAYGAVKIVVRDRGIGIAPDFLPRVFDLFAQADRSLDRSRGGLGLGLTLAKRLIELHGGTLTVASAGLGQGSEFAIHLPAWVEKDDAASSDERAGIESPIGQGRRVLVVDDSTDAAESMAALIEFWGHRTRVLNGGAGVIDVVREFDPDVVLLDIGLPGVSGYELARRIRADDGGHSRVLAALTGYGRDDDRSEAEAAGFDHHLVKPIDLDHLRALLSP